VATAPSKRTPRPTLPLTLRERYDPLPPAPIPLPAAGTLSVNSMPWGELTIDGTPAGNTPQSAVILRSGKHTIRITRDGYQAYETTIDLAPGGTIRLTQITLKELTL
jgi:hypothetical protein